MKSNLPSLTTIESNLQTNRFRLIRSARKGFTRLELLVALATLLLLATVVIPSFGRSREGGHGAVCSNNLRQLGVALMMYSEENRDLVAEEGNTVLPINDPGNADAWYNLAVQPTFARLRDLYNSSATVPMPQDGAVFSCPSAPRPTFTPNLTKAYFMYGMNARICINKSTRATGTVNTKLSSIPLPDDTILMGEVDGNLPVAGAAQSNLTSPYSIARHQGVGFFAMADGHVRTARTNEFLRAETSAVAEWAVPRKMYWYPTSTTPN